MSDFDSPWKDILDVYFPEFLAFFFPAIHAAIAWSRGHEMLDKELQQVTRAAELTRRTVDKLAGVWRQDGQEEWVLIHVEVQSQDESDFPERMFVYYFRLFDRFQQQIVSLAVLGDDSPNWRPQRYERELWHCRLVLEFPVVKLLDYAHDLAALEDSPNPFATAVLAHLQTQRTRTDPPNRRLWKIRLIRRLYERGASRAEILNLWRFIDWLMDLPRELEESCWQEIRQIEEEKQMPYMTSTERMWADKYLQEGLAKGRQEGWQEGQLEALREGVAVALELKFGAAGLQMVPALASITEADKLHTLLRAIKTAQSLDELHSLLNS
ncbi:MAG: hypothetical protein ACK4RK_10195 [Gemmataceae bacterium]